MPAPRPKTVGENPQVLVHGQGGKANIDAVKEGNEVQQHDERNNAQGNFAHHLLFEVVIHDGMLHSDVGLLSFCNNPSMKF